MAVDIIDNEGKTMFDLISTQDRGTSPCWHDPLTGGAPGAESSKMPQAAPESHLGVLAELAAPTPARAEQGTQTPIHDVHGHAFGPGYCARQVYDIRRTLAANVTAQMPMLDEAGTERTTWAPIPTHIVETRGNTAWDTSGHAITQGRTYYLPNHYRLGLEAMTANVFQQVTPTIQTYDPGVDYQVGKAYAELPEALRRRIIPAITGFNPGDTNGIAHILRLKNEFPDTFHWIGEITLYKEVVDRQNRDFTPRMDAGAPVNDYFRLAARMGTPVTVHCDVSDAATCIEHDAPGDDRHLPAFSELVGRHPGTRIVWAHVGGIGKFGPPGPQHEQNLERLLARHPNLYIDLSWDAVAQYYSPTPRPSLSAAPGQAFDPAADLALRQQRIERLAQVIRKFPDRFVMGSDALVTRNATSLNSTYALYSNFGRGAGTGGRIGLFDYLPPATLEAVLHGNFDHLADTAVEASRAFEHDVLPGELQRLQAETECAGAVPNVW